MGTTLSEATDKISGVINTHNSKIDDYQTKAEKKSCNTCSMEKKSRFSMEDNDAYTQNDNEIFNDKELNTIHVSGNLGPKVTSVLRSLGLVQRKREKALVFSEWDEMLDIVQHGMELNDIKFLRLKGGSRRSATSVIENFKASIYTSVLMLPIKSGAQGLTLIEANHVFLLEPIFNPAAEAQAINRIHRIGQTKQTFVHKFIVKDTVEERVNNVRFQRIQHELGDNSVDSNENKTA